MEREWTEREAKTLLKAAYERGQIGETTKAAVERHHSDRRPNRALEVPIDHLE